MYSRIIKFLSSPRTIYWAKTLSKFLSLQLVIQALNALSGILIVRTLSKQEYAYFTIANSLQSIATLLADIGIGTSLSALGGKVWQDRYRFGQLINTAINLRYSLAKVSVVVVIPILYWMLTRNGASIGYTLLITVFVLVGVNFQLTNGILIVVPRLHSEIDFIQRFDFFSTVSRTLLIVVSSFTFINAAVSVAIASIISGLQRFFLGRWAIEKIDRNATIDQEYTNFTISNIKRCLPNTLFFCFQGQLNVFLISLFGNTNSIAEVGALGRIALLFSVLGAVMTSIVLPSFSRCQSYKILVRRYFQLLLLFGLLSILLISIVLLVPEKVLFILGSKYSNLRNELLLMVILTLVNFLAEIMSGINLSKAWIDHIWMEIPLRLVLQVFLLIFLDVSTVRGVLLLNLISLFSPIIVNAYLTYNGFRRYKLSNDTL